MYLLYQSFDRIQIRLRHGLPVGDCFVGTVRAKGGTS